jgi:hypothetical protein
MSKGPRLGLGILVLGLVVATGAACAKARAEMVADGPPLEVPAAPPRVLAPIDDTVTAASPPVDPVTTPPQAAPSGTQTRRQAPRADNEGREPASTPAPAAVAPPTPALPDAPRDLRPANSAADAEAEKKIRGLMSQALQNLSRVEYRTLSVDNKAQYDDARRFVERAEQAIKDRNFVYAETHADKAATLAAQLIGR